MGTTFQNMYAKLGEKKKGWYLRPHEDKFQMGTTFQKFSECIDQSLEILGRN
jgi:hypothetical protein